MEVPFSSAPAPPPFAAELPAAGPASPGAPASAAALTLDSSRSTAMETARGPDTARSYGSARSGGLTARSAFAPSQYSYRSRGSGGGVSLCTFLRTASRSAVQSGAF